MKKFILIIVAFPYFNCNNTNDQKSIIDSSTIDKVQTLRSQNYRSPLCLIFCDFTTSIDSNNAKIILENSRQIFKDLYDSFNIQFYSIDNIEFSQPFFSNKCVTSEQIDTSEKLGAFDKENITYALLQQKKLLEDSLSNMIQNIDTSKFLHNSCIVNAISKAVGIFNKYDPTYNSKCKLIFLSDMLECCDNANGFINLEKGFYDDAIEKIKLKSSTLSLAQIGIKSDNVQAIVFTNRTTDQKLKKFWQIVFAQYGFNNFELSHSYQSISKPSL